MRAVALRFASLALAIGLIAAGCAEHRSRRCREVCDREARCADELASEEFAVNKGECVRKCTDLDRSEEGAERVTTHVSCVNAAADCREVLECP